MGPEGVQGATGKPPAERMISMFYRFQTGVRMSADGAAENRLYISGPIEPQRPWWDWEKEEPMAAANEFRAELDKLDGQPLTIVIDSDGGDLGAGLTMYNAIRARKGETKAVIWHAYSAATMPLCACRGGRAISPVGTLLIHNPATWATGDHREMEKAKTFLAAMKDAAIAAYREVTGMGYDELAKMMDDETVLTAEAAVRLGFADTIMEAGSVQGEDAVARAKSAMAASMAATRAGVEQLLKAQEADRKDAEERERIAAWAEAL